MAEYMEDLKIYQIDACVLPNKKINTLGEIVSQAYIILYHNLDDTLGFMAKHIQVDTVLKSEYSIYKTEIVSLIIPYKVRIYLDENDFIGVTV